MLNQLKPIAKNSVLCWLATANANNFPNVSPKEIWAIFDDHTIIIAEIASPTSVKNITANNLVCLSFIDIFVQKGYKIKGIAEIINKTHRQFAELSVPLVAIAGQKFPFTRIIKIVAKEVEDLVAPSYLFYPAETSQESQRLAAMTRYNVFSP